MTSRQHGHQEMLSEVQLPCGKMLRNRLVKAAMYEHMAPLLGGPPNELYYALYSRWARGGWGMIITGNVQVSRSHLGLGRDVIVPHTFEEKSLRPYKTWASIIHGEDNRVESKRHTLAIMQLCHPGRQSANVLGGRWPGVPPLAPSAVPMGLKARNGSSASATPLLGTIAQKLLFQTPRTMTPADIDHVVEDFVRGSQLAFQAGFDGVQVHAAHGYLITQFMSPKTNVRTDEYSAQSPLLLLHRIVTSIRAPGVVPKDFVVGIKLNAADYVESDAGLVASEDRALQHLQAIAAWGLVDFIEISGGDYDSPDFMPAASPSRRQAVFAGFSKRAMHALTSVGDSVKRPLIMLTGGLHSPELMRSALVHHHADLLGIGRCSVLYPELPIWLSQDSTTLPKSAFPLMEPLADLPWRHYLESWAIQTVIGLWDCVPTELKPEMPGLIGAGAETARYAVLMRALARGRDQTYYPGEDLAVTIRFWWYIAPGRWQITLLFAVAAGFLSVALVFCAQLNFLT